MNKDLLGRYLDLRRERRRLSPDALPDAARGEMYAIVRRWSDEEYARASRLGDDEAREVDADG